MNLAKEQNDLICSLKELGCKGMAEALSNQFANEYSFCELTFSQRLRDLIDREACSQKKQKYNRLIKQGKLKYLLTFNDIHFGEQDGISKDDLNYLISNHLGTSKSCEYLYTRENRCRQDPDVLRFT